jgi:hypothetical protein
MVTTRGIWIGKPAAQVDYDAVLTSLTDIGGTVTGIQAAVLQFIAQYGGATPSTPTIPVSVTFAALKGVPSDNPALSQAFSDLAVQLRNEITNGAGAAFEALESIKALLADGDDTSTALLNAIAACLKFDGPQSLTPAQKTQALTNLGIVARLVPEGGTLGQVLGVTADGIGFLNITSGAPSQVDPLVTQALNTAATVSSAMRLRTLSIGTE